RVKAFEEKLRQLKRDYERFKRLYEKGVVPARQFEKVETELRAATREYEALKASLEEVSKQKLLVLEKGKVVKELAREIEALNEKLKALGKKKEELELLISYAELRSPIDGFVVKKFVKEGELVRPGQFVYAVYDPSGVYVLVLLDERKLEGVKVGSRARIKLDAFPDEEFEGVVTEINRAVASKFAVIPRDVTAGEFTKVAQRVPVKIKITKGDKRKLILGQGGEVIIEKR
ncbi:MAG: HlyD family secretion protein, partial [Aquificae bacterium]|nr:HlyD family secretion protein [Aquificota bacterium]